VLEEIIDDFVHHKSKMIFRGFIEMRNDEWIHTRFFRASKSEFRLRFGHLKYFIKKKKNYFR
jgi:hypothetical protein